MGKLYRLGLTVGVIQHDMRDQERQDAYRADVTYGTNNELGFDYLRDNMKFDPSLFVHRIYAKLVKDADGKEAEKLFHYAIVDEVDSILIDEARTPLIISGPAEESTDLYYRIDRIIPRLRRDLDFTVDEKTRTVTLTEEGVPSVEKLLQVDNLYEPSQMHILHHVYQALRAHTLYKRDADYMVKDGQVIIVDEFTGRLMPGRRWSDGLHQAVEAKEHVKIERENQTLATITFQNYFRMYGKLAGMTGTAETEAAEFEKIYWLEVVPVPTNRNLIRDEYPDMVYRTEREKLDAVVEEIRDMNQQGRPVLVGTTSIGKSEKLSQMLKRGGVKHVVLNAKYHEMEAEIVAQAGRKAAVTIATNMAGRGTDILLGGNAEYLAKVATKKKAEEGELPPNAWEEALAKAKREVANEHEEVVAKGGLHILGTERHESRRIDNQLRGRAGRQGDPGSSRFYLSLEDDLMRIFGSDRISGLMQKMGMEEGVPIEHGMVTRAIERAQKQVEGQNFSMRKHLLEYDDVMNKQRVAIYRLRREILEGKEQREYVLELAENVLEFLFNTHLGPDVSPEDWDVSSFRQALGRQFGLDSGTLSGIDWEGLSREQIRTELRKRILDKVPEEGSGHRTRPDAHPRAHHHAAGGRHPVEGPPLRDGPPQGGHRAARLRAAGSVDRVQEGKLRHVRGDVGSDRGGDREGPLPPAAGARALYGAAAGGATAPALVQRPGGSSHRARRLPLRRSCRRRSETGIAGGRRRRREDGATGGRESGKERPMPLRQRKEIQEMLRRRHKLTP
jgi:preprotein translocase subunit SecA